MYTPSEQNHLSAVFQNYATFLLNNVQGPRVKIQSDNIKFGRVYSSPLQLSILG